MSKPVVLKKIGAHFPHLLPKTQTLGIRGTSSGTKIFPLSVAFPSVGHKSALRVCECVCECVAPTCARSYQPAVQEASSQGVVEDHGPLAVDRLQNVLHGDWDVGVGAASRLLARLLTLHEEVGKGPRPAPLGDGQRLVVPAWEGNL